jgi:hypothetical protein
MSEESRREAAVVDSEVRSAAKAELSFHPSSWRSYACPSCGTEMLVLRGIEEGLHLPPTEERCEDCDRKERARRRLDVLEDHDASRSNRQHRLAKAGVPPRYWRRRFVEPAEWPRDPRFPDVDLRGWSGDPWCVTFAGVVEAGKTYLATELFDRLLRAGHAGLFVRAGEVIQQLYTAEPSVRDQRWRELVNIEVLFVDELGRGAEGKALSTLVELISMRFDYERPTIFTTNTSLAPAPRDGSGRLQPGFEKGLPDLDAGLFRRLFRDGLMIGLMERWTAPARTETEEVTP